MEKYLDSPGGVRRVGVFREEARRLGPLVEQVLWREALGLGDVPDLQRDTHKQSLHQRWAGEQEELP